MTTYLVDASVAAKWVLPPKDEPLAREATSLFIQSVEGGVRLAVPDLFWIEMTNILCKAAARGRISSIDAAGRVKWLRSLNIPSIPTKPLMAEALRIASTHNRSAYDAFYVALAASTGWNLITADERLVNTLGSRFPVRWLGSIH